MLFFKAPVDELIMLRERFYSVVVECGGVAERSVLVSASFFVVVVRIRIVALPYCPVDVRYSITPEYSTTYSSNPLSTG
jgi:hypothetical protein